MSILNLKIKFQYLLSFTLVLAIVLNFHLVSAAGKIYASPGMRNGKVVAIKQMLEGAGINLSAYKVSYGGRNRGLYGPGTRDAVKEFQIKNDLTPTGNVDRDTLKALKNQKDPAFLERQDRLNESVAEQNPTDNEKTTPAPESKPIENFRPETLIPENSNPGRLDWGKYLNLRAERVDTDVSPLNLNNNSSAPVKDETPTSPQEVLARIKSNNENLKILSDKIEELPEGSERDALQSSFNELNSLNQNELTKLEKSVEAARADAKEQLVALKEINDELKRVGENSKDGGETRESTKIDYICLKYGRCIPVKKPISVDKRCAIDSKSTSDASCTDVETSAELAKKPGEKSLVPPGAESPATNGRILATKNAVVCRILGPGAPASCKLKSQKCDSAKKDGCVQPEAKRIAETPSTNN